MCDLFTPILYMQLFYIVYMSMLRFIPICINLDFVYIVVTMIFVLCLKLNLEELNANFQQEYICQVRQNALYKKPTKKTHS
jgi:hypothetical protein